MKRRNSNIQTLIGSLQADQGGSALIQAASQSLELQRVLKSWPALRGVSFQAGPIKQDKLTLYVASPSALARIKQSVPSLIGLLQSRGWIIHQIQVKVQTLSGSSNQFVTPRKKANISPKGLESWNALKEKLDDPDLLAATTRLTIHHGDS